MGCTLIKRSTLAFLKNLEQGFDFILSKKTEREAQRRDRLWEFFKDQDGFLYYLIVRNPKTFRKFQQ